MTSGEGLKHYSLMQAVAEKEGMDTTRPCGALRRDVIFTRRKGRQSRVEARLLHHLAVGEEVESVARTHLLGDGNGADLPLDGLIYGLHLDTDLFDDETH